MSSSKIINQQTYTASRSDWESMCQSIAKEYWGLTFDLPVYLNEKLTVYGAFLYQRVYDENKNVYVHQPTCIEVSQEAYETFDFDRMLDLLKHEVCHWACMVQGKPFRDKTIHFERELRRIGAITTGIDMHDAHYKEKSAAASDAALTKPNRIGGGEIDNIQVYLIRKQGRDHYGLEEGGWTKINNSGKWASCQKYDYTYFFTFHYNDERYVACIALLDGKWQMANQKTGIYQVNDSQQKIHFDRKTMMRLRGMAIKEAELLNQQLSLI